MRIKQKFDLLQLVSSYRWPHCKQIYFNLFDDAELHGVYLFSNISDQFLF